MSGKSGAIMTGKSRIFLALLLSFNAISLGRCATIGMNRTIGKPYCMFKNFDEDCGPGHVILIEHALFGRMRHSICSEVGDLGCQHNVTDKLQAMCSGRQHCKVPVIDFQTLTAGCYKDYVSHLEVLFKCVYVTEYVQSSGKICLNRKPVILHNTNGHVSSAVAMETGYGSRDCPWKLSAQPGQLFNISVYDFGIMTKTEAGKWSGINFYYSNCPITLVARSIFPNGTGRTSTMEPCVNINGDYPVRRRYPTLMYTSLSYDVTMYITLNTGSNRIPKFLFKYEVTGCAKLPSPLGGVISQDSQVASVKCNKTGETWTLRCENSKWIGHHRNCTEGSSWSLRNIFGTEVPVSQGIILAITIGVALGVIFGSSLLLSVLYCRKIMQHPVKRQQGQYPDDGDQDPSSYPALLKSSDGSTVHADMGRGGYYAADYSHKGFDPRQDLSSQGYSLDQRVHLYESPTRCPKTRNPNDPLPTYDVTVPVYYDVDSSCPMQQTLRT